MDCWTLWCELQINFGQRMWVVLVNWHVQYAIRMRETSSMSLIMTDEYALLGSVVARCIDLQPGHNERARLLRNVIANGESVFTVGKVYEHLKEVRALANLQGDDDDGAGQDAGQVFDELLRNRIVASATDPEFWEGARWFYLLEVAWTLDGRDEVLKRVEAHVRRDDNLLGFCEAFLEMREDDDIGSGVGDPESKERGDIRSWLPEGAETRLTRLAAEAEDVGTIVRAQWALARSYGIPG